jgi:hypothetical protein
MTAVGRVNLRGGKQCVCKENGAAGAPETGYIYYI